MVCLTAIFFLKVKFNIVYPCLKSREIKDFQYNIMENFTLKGLRNFYYLVMQVYILNQYLISFLKVYELITHLYIFTFENKF